MTDFVKLGMWVVLCFFTRGKWLQSSPIFITQLYAQFFQIWALFSYKISKLPNWAEKQLGSWFPCEVDIRYWWRNGFLKFQNCYSCKMFHPLVGRFHPLLMTNHCNSSGGVSILIPRGWYSMKLLVCSS